MNTLNVKRGDQVVVLSGKDKGKKGKVLTVDPKNGMVIVEGINIVSRHTKPRKQGQQGGIIKKESNIHACKVMRLCPKCNQPTRVRRQIVDGQKQTVCVKCAAVI